MFSHILGQVEFKRAVVNPYQLPMLPSNGFQTSVTPEHGVRQNGRLCTRCWASVFGKRIEVLVDAMFAPIAVLGGLIVSRSVECDEAAKISPPLDRGEVVGFYRNVGCVNRCVFSSVKPCANDCRLPSGSGASNFNARPNVSTATLSIFFGRSLRRRRKNDHAWYALDGPFYLFCCSAEGGVVADRGRGLSLDAISSRVFH